MTVPSRWPMWHIGGSDGHGTWVGFLLPDTLDANRMMLEGREWEAFWDCPPDCRGCA